MNWCRGKGKSKRPSGREFTNGNLEVIRSFGSRVRWETGPNRGGCAARNRGIELAEGASLQFLDSDDLLHPEKIVRMLAPLGTDHKQIDFSDFSILNLASGASTHSPRPVGDPESFRYILEAERLQTSAPLYPANALKEVGGFDTNLPCAQEYDLNLRLALRGWHFRRLKEALFQVRSRTVSVSSSYARVLRQHDVIFRKLLEQNPGTCVSLDDLVCLLSWRYVRNARLLTNLDDEEGARIAVARASQLGIHSGIQQAFSGKSRGLAYVLGPIQAERAIQRLVSIRRGFQKSGTAMRGVA